MDRPLFKILVKLGQITLRLNDGWLFINQKWGIDGLQEAEGSKS